MRISTVLTLLLLSLLTACSSPPKVVQAPSKAAADATLRMAQNLEQKHRLLDSRQTYQSALGQYRSFADLRGELYCLAGLARVAYMQGDMAEYDRHYEALKYLDTRADQAGFYVRLLLDIFRMQKEQRYDEIQALAKDSYDYPLPIRIQILTHRLQADSYLEPGLDSSSFADLERLSKSYRRQIKKDFTADSSVLTSALYAMGYHLFVKSDYYGARGYIDEVVRLDALYEDYPALGYAHWLRARIHEGNKDHRQATTDYICARKIFTHFENSEMLARTDAALKRLEGERQ
ncbi:MAG: hypothetical protein PHR27_04130 [Candidatus Cloacimonetes bacterium]|nr:hypothetical protein [Candidatus Cloacimonadota bacterium]